MPSTIPVQKDSTTIFSFILRNLKHCAYPARSGKECMMKKNRYMRSLEDFGKEPSERQEIPKEEPAEEPRVLTPEEQAEADRKTEEVINKEIKHIAIGSAVCLVLMFAVFAALKRFGTPVLLAGLIGTAATLVCFIYLGRSVQAAASMGERGPAYLKRTYMVRVAINLAVVGVAAGFDQLDTVAGILPLFFPRITIFAMQLLGMYKPQ